MGETAAFDFLDGVKLKSPSKLRRFVRRLCPRLVADEYDPKKHAGSVNNEEEFEPGDPLYFRAKA